MFETVKEVNGYSIIRMKGMRGYYRVWLTDYKYAEFKTIKSAVEYIEKNLKAVS